MYQNRSGRKHKNNTVTRDKDTYKFRVSNKIMENAGSENFAVGFSQTSDNTSLGHVTSSPQKRNNSFNVTDIRLLGCDAAL